MNTVRTLALVSLAVMAAASVSACKKADTSNATDNSVTNTTTTETTNAADNSMTTNSTTTTTNSATNAAH